MRELMGRYPDAGAFGKANLRGFGAKNPSFISNFIDKNSRTQLDRGSVRGEVGKSSWYFLHKVPISRVNARTHGEVTPSGKEDLSLPIVVGAKWNVLDGRHRVMLAKSKGVGELPAYVPAELLYQMLMSRKSAAVVYIDDAWVDKMRKDFLALLKNIPKVKDYKTGIRLKDAINLWSKRFKDLFFDEYLNKSLKYDQTLSDRDRKSYDRMLRSIGWDLYIELGSMPLDRADDYYSEGARFAQFEMKARLWSNRVKKKARKFWKEVRYIVQHYEKIKLRSPDDPDKIEVKMHDTYQTVIEGFKLVIRGYEPDFEPYVEGLERVKAALKVYRQRISQVAPILKKHQLPMVIDFHAGTGKGGEYRNDHIMISGTLGVGSDSTRSVVKTMAHEMGHHIIHIISNEAEKFWSKLIYGDLGNLDLREVVAQWPGDKWAYEYVDYLAPKDPILALQIDTVWQGYDPGGGSRPLDKKESFQALIDKGITTVAVPKNPITAYASLNPAEAFCEVLGMLVAYGPRAVLPKVRKWLNIILPGEIKLANQVAARWAADRIRAYKVMSLVGGKLVSGANSRLSFPARKGTTIRMPGNGLYMSPNKQYVLTYYSGLADNEVLLTLEFSKGDIKWGNLTDREAEVAASPVKIIDIEPLDDD